MKLERTHTWLPYSFAGDQDFVKTAILERFLFRFLLYARLCRLPRCFSFSPNAKIFADVWTGMKLDSFSFSYK